MLSRKKWFYLVLAICIGAGAIGVTVMQNRRVEETLRYIEELPGNLRAESVEADLLRDRVIVRNLRGEYALFPDAPYEISCELLELEGVNRQAETVKGVVKLVDKARVTNYHAKAKGESFPLLFQEIRLQSAEYDGLWADLSLFARVTKPTDEAWLNYLLSLRYGNTRQQGIYYTMPMPMLLVDGATEQQKFLTVRAVKSEADTYTLREMGRSWSEEVAYGEEGVYTVSMKTMRMESTQTPPAAIAMILRGTGITPEESITLWVQYFQQGYSMRGAVAEDLEVRLEAAPGVIRTPKIVLDVAMGNGEMIFALQSGGIRIPLDTVLGWMPQLSELKTVVGEESLDVNVDLDIRTTRDENDSVLLTARQELTEKTLGDAKLDISISGRTSRGAPYLPMDSGSMALSEGRLELNDRKALDVLFSVPGWEDTYGGETTAAERRERDARRIEEKKDAAGSKLNVIFDALAGFIRESGSLIVTVKADKTIPFMSLVLDPDALLKNLTITAEHKVPQ